MKTKNNGILLNQRVHNLINMVKMNKNIIRQRETFDDNVVSLKDIRYKKMNSILNKLLKGKVLEIGCSSGEFLASLQKKGWEVKGLEISKKATQEAIKKGIDVTVHDANEKLPIEDDSFDVVISGETIEHLFEDVDFLNECYRVLKKDGILIITTPNLTSLKNRILMLFGFNPRYAIADYHYKVYTFPWIQRLYKKSKFQKSKTKFRGNFIIFSSGREKILGTLFEKWADYMPSLAEHYIVVSKK